MKPAINITNLFTAINSATMIEMAPEITDANKTSNEYDLYEYKRNKISSLTESSGKKTIGLPLSLGMYELVFMWKEIFEKLHDCWSEYMSLAEAAIFEYAFKLGAKFMLECMTDHN